MRNLYIAKEEIAGKIIPGFRIGYSQPTQLPQDHGQILIYHQQRVP